MGDGGTRGHRGSGSVAAAASLTWTKHAQWTDAAQLGLERALGDYADDVRAAVNAGRMELFCVGGASWIVTEVRADTLIIWCYQGVGARFVVPLLLRLCRRNGLETLEYSTRHKSLPRLLRSFGFELVAIDDEGISRYQVTVQ